jgi:hypothetical protein
MFDMQRHSTGDRSNQHETAPYDQRTLADHPDETMFVQCDQCPSISRHDKAALIQRFGADAPLAEVLRKLCRPRHPEEPEHEPHLLEP